MVTKVLIDEQKLEILISRISRGGGRLRFFLEKAYPHHRVMYCPFDDTYKLTGYCPKIYYLE